MSTKQLFILYNIHTHKHSDITFMSKPVAKEHRDIMNGGLSSDLDKTWAKDKGWRVTYGSDHWRYTQ